MSITIDKGILYDTFCNTFDDNNRSVSSGFARSRQVSWKRATGLQSIIVKAIWYGYFPRSFSTLDELREDSDDKLFFSARYNPNHVLHRLLPQPKSIEHNLRQHTHNLTLPMDVSVAMKQNFVYRMPFRDVY